MLASADFLGADLKELFKTASVPALRWWLQFRSLVNSASCKNCMHAHENQHIHWDRDTVKRTIINYWQTEEIRIHLLYLLE